MPRKRNPLVQQMLDAAPQVPVNITVTLPWGFLRQIDVACKTFGIFKYELTAAALYSFMLEHDLAEEDETLAVYVRRVEELVRLARQQETD